MKKFLAILMLLAMCFSCAAMAETTDEDLAAAKTYLFMMYKDLPETTMSDYEVVGVINIGGIDYVDGGQRHHQDCSAGQQDGHHRCG